MVDYDVIVCGAGPAGTMAAATAAQRGLKVALLEKQVLPRHKTCGGGMPMVAHQFLQDLAPDAFVESDVRYMRHTWNFSDPYLGAINPPGSDRDISLWMVQRAIFDNALAQRAATAGAELRDGLAVRSLEVEGDRVTVRAQGISQDGQEQSGRAFVATARYVIGADGANGLTTRVTNLRPNRLMAIAMEIEYPYDWSQDKPDLRPDIAHLEYGAVKQGYAWIFPKADHLNVGSGVFRPSKRDRRSEKGMRDELQRAIFNYLELFHLPYDPEQLHFHVHPLPIWQGKEARQTPDGRILLAGDAAGLVNPFFGDGILHAMKSGTIAGECVAEGTAQQYTQRLHQEFSENFDAALKMAGFFYQWPEFCYKNAVKRESATRTAARLLCGDAVFQDLTNKVINRLRGLAFGTSSLT